MKVLVDTNILISAVSKENGHPNRLLRADFLALDLSHPRCMTVADFCEQENI